MELVIRLGARKKDEWIEIGKVTKKERNMALK